LGYENYREGEPEAHQTIQRISEEKVIPVINNAVEGNIAISVGSA